jgi:hypothetical protein
MDRNLKKDKEKTEMYLGSKIYAFTWIWEEFNKKKDKWENKKQVMCNLYRLGSNNQPLNLGECNNGDKFTSVNQAINQAKGFIDTCNEMGWGYD